MPRLQSEEFFFCRPLRSTKADKDGREDPFLMRPVDSGRAHTLTPKRRRECSGKQVACRNKALIPSGICPILSVAKEWYLFALSLLRKRTVRNLQKQAPVIRGRLKGVPSW
jgi:hypothetical protein